MIGKLYHYIRFNLLRNKYSKNNKLSNVITLGTKITLSNCSFNDHAKYTTMFLMYNSIINSNNDTGLKKLA